MIVVAVPRFPDEADLDNPQEMFAWLFSGWPHVGESRPYPQAPDPFIPHHSQLAYDLGFRYHPELATVKKVRDKSGYGYKYIPVGDPDPVLPKPAAEPEDEVVAMLQEVDPALAKHIAGLSEDERRAELKAREPDFKKSLAVLQRLMAEGDD